MDKSEPKVDNMSGGISNYRLPSLHQTTNENMQLIQSKVCDWYARTFLEELHKQFHLKTHLSAANKPGSKEQLNSLPIVRKIMDALDNVATNMDMQVAHYMSKIPLHGWKNEESKDYIETILNGDPDVLLPIKNLASKLFSSFGPEADYNLENEEKERIPPQLMNARCQSDKDLWLFFSLLIKKVQDVMQGIIEKYIFTPFESGDDVRREKENRNIGIRKLENMLIIGKILLKKLQEFELYKCNVNDKPWLVDCRTLETPTKLEKLPEANGAETEAECYYIYDEEPETNERFIYRAQIRQCRNTSRNLEKVKCRTEVSEFEEHQTKENETSGYKSLQCKIKTPRRKLHEYDCSKGTAKTKLSAKQAEAFGHKMQEFDYKPETAKSYFHSEILDRGLKYDAHNDTAKDKDRSKNIVKFASKIPTPTFRQSLSVINEKIEKSSDNESEMETNSNLFSEHFTKYTISKTLTYKKTAGLSKVVDRKHKLLRTRPNHRRSKPKNQNHQSKSQSDDKLELHSVIKSPITPEASVETYQVLPTISLLARKNMETTLNLFPKTDDYDTFTTEYQRAFGKNNQNVNSLPPTLGSSAFKANPSPPHATPASSPMKAEPRQTQPYDNLPLSTLAYSPVKDKQPPAQAYDNFSLLTSASSPLNANSSPPTLAAKLHSTPKKKAKKHPIQKMASRKLPSRIGKQFSSRIMSPPKSAPLTPYSSLLALAIEKHSPTSVALDKLPINEPEKSSIEHSTIIVAPPLYIPSPRLGANFSFSF